MRPHEHENKLRCENEQVPGNRSLTCVPRLASPEKAKHYEDVQLTCSISTSSGEILLSLRDGGSDTGFLERMIIEGHLERLPELRVHAKHAYHDCVAFKAF